MPIALCAFEFDVEDSLSEYNFTVNVRHRANYPYQNMWLFVQQISPDSSIVNDTIEFYLADNRGKWLGKGIGAVYTMPVLIKNNQKLDKMDCTKLNCNTECAMWNFMA
jgi:gliding motility-associated lipoprotein GldH